MIGTVYHREYDRYGDPVETLAGDIPGVVLGGRSVDSLDDIRGDVSVTSGLIGIPKDSGVPVESGDRIDIVGVGSYVVSGPKLWNYPSSLTGSEFGHYWMQAEANA